MKKWFFFLFAALLTVSCGSSSKSGGDKIQEAVDALNETTPAKSWDGESLKSAKYDEEDNVVEFCIKNAHQEDSISDRKWGTWYIANFMTSYDYFTEEDDGEGEKEMYMAMAPLLELLAEEGVGVRFALEFRNGGSTTINLTPKEVKKAVKLRKEDCLDYIR